MMRRMALALVVLSLSAATAAANTFSDPTVAGFQPLVPISALGAPAAWFDPSRLHMSSTIAVGSGFGSGTSGLQTTSFSYQFRAPVSMSVSVGNAFGAGTASRNASFFLQGLNLSWHPNGNSLVQLQFHNLRSPLQYGYGYGDAAERAFWGY